MKTPETAVSPVSSSLPLKVLQLIVALFMAFSALGIVVVLIRVLNGYAVNFNFNGQQIPYPTLTQLTLMLLAFCGTQALVWLLYSVLQRTRQGKIFVRENVRDLRTLGFAGLAWWAITPIMSLLFAVEGKEFAFELNTNQVMSPRLLVPLILFIFAEVLREGLRLHESEMALRREQELTI